MLTKDLTSWSRKVDVTKNKVVKALIKADKESTVHLCKDLIWAEFLIE
jgi:hypothetical protein